MTESIQDMQDRFEHENRPQTQMYFVSAEDLHGRNLRKFIEAKSKRQAYDIWYDLVGGNDGEEYPIDYDDATVIEVPECVGHVGHIRTELNDCL